jgi:CheY-like chemotaxis protein
MNKKLNCILLIEDNELTNIFNERLIKSLDIAENIYISETAEKGLDFLCGLGKYKTTNCSVPDLIFLDINMPGMNGWEFIEEYRKLNKAKVKPVKIMMLTTSPNPDDEQKAKSIKEIIGFKRKPLTKDILNEILKDFFPDYL